MRKVFVFLICLPLSAISQSDSLFTDSVQFYRKLAGEVSKRFRDSINLSPDYILAQQRLRHYSSLSDNYAAFTVFGDVIRSDYSRFNSSIAASGFPPMEETGFRMGFGMSLKYKRTMIDILLGSFGFNNKSEKGDEEIRLSSSNVFVFDIGFDLLKSNYINIYPYAGMSLHGSDLNYTKPKQLNNNFTNITDIIINDGSVRTSSSKLGYQAGLGIDVLISNGWNRNSGTFAFAKAGSIGTIKKHKYEIANTQYDPGISHGKWIVSFGFKFFGKT